MCSLKQKIVFLICIAQVNFMSLMILCPSLKSSGVEIHNPLSQNVYIGAYLISSTFGHMKNLLSVQL